jgi:hypothetical protein
MLLRVYPESGPAVPTRVRLRLYAPIDGPDPLPWEVRTSEGVRKGTLRPDQTVRLTVTAPTVGDAYSSLVIVPGAARRHPDGRTVPLRAVVESVSPAAG